MKLNNLIFTALAGFSIILAGCQNNDENEQHYDNKLFISASNFTKEILFKAGDTNVETGLSVAIAKPEEHDIKVTMSPAPELLSTYKLAYYDETAVLLSEEHYSMPETSTTIKSGSIVSPELPIALIQENLISKPLMCFQSLLNQWKESAFCKVLRHIIMYSAEHHLLMWYVISVVIVLIRTSRMTPNSII